MTVKRACAVLAAAVTRAKKTYAEVERRTEQRHVGFSKFIASTIKIVIQSLLLRERTRAVVRIWPVWTVWTLSTTFYPAA